MFELNNGGRASKVIKHVVFAVETYGSVSWSVKVHSEQIQNICNIPAADWFPGLFSVVARS